MVLLNVDIKAAFKGPSLVTTCWLYLQDCRRQSKSPSFSSLVLGFSFSIFDNHDSWQRLVRSSEPAVTSVT